MMGSVNRGLSTKGLFLWAAFAIAISHAHGENASDGSVQVLDNDNLALAVDEWISDPNLATAKYGPIQDWDTSRVTDMNGLFQGRANFNDDVSNWNTSLVTDMAFLFHGATSFNQDLFWDTRNVRFMDNIFNFATSFNGDISSWSTESLQSMDYAFSHASSFNINISSWNTKKVKYMAYAFWNATSFSQDLNPWSVANVEDMEGIFYNASAFDQVLCWDDINENGLVSKLFCGSLGSLDPDCVSSELLAVVGEKCDDQNDSLSNGESDESSAPVDPMVTTTSPGSETVTLVQKPTVTQSVLRTPAPKMIQQENHETLMYVAIAFATSTIALMVFLVILVIYKRRQFKEIQRTQHRPRDAPTVLEEVISDEED